MCVSACARITLTELPNGTNANDVILCLPSWDVQIGFPKNMLTFWTPRKCPKNEMVWASVQMPHLYFCCFLGATWSIVLQHVEFSLFYNSCRGATSKRSKKSNKKVPKQNTQISITKRFLFFLSKKKRASSKRLPILATTLLWSAPGPIQQVATPIRVACLANIRPKTSYRIFVCQSWCCLIEKRNTMIWLICLSKLIFLKTARTHFFNSIWGAETPLFYHLYIYRLNHQNHGHSASC